MANQGERIHKLMGRWCGKETTSISLQPERLSRGCVVLGTIERRKGNLKGLQLNLCHMKANMYLEAITMSKMGWS